MSVIIWAAAVMGISGTAVWAQIHRAIHFRTAAVVGISGTAVWAQIHRANYSRTIAGVWIHGTTVWAKIIRANYSFAVRIWVRPIRTGVNWARIWRQVILWINLLVVVDYFWYWGKEWPNDDAVNNHAKGVSTPHQLGDHAVLDKLA